MVEPFTQIIAALYRNIGNTYVNPVALLFFFVNENNTRGLGVVFLDQLLSLFLDQCFALIS